MGDQFPRPECQLCLNLAIQRAKDDENTQLSTIRQEIDIQKSKTRILDDIETELECHSKTLYGENRDNGLVRQVKSHDDRIEAAEADFRAAKKVLWMSICGLVGLIAKALFNHFILKTP